MSLQSEGTIFSEDDCLEDVVLELLKEKGILSQVKGQIAKFIQDNGKVNSKRFIIAERADERILSYIYEYLQWIGMKQTCSVLLSESPVKVDHSIVKKPDDNYRPKLHSLLDQLPPELDSKFLSFRKSEHERSNVDSMPPPPPTKRLDDLIGPTKNSSLNKDGENSFLTSTPRATPAAADATFVIGFENKSDSNLLMGFSTPISSEGFGGKPKKPFVPERLFQDDPFLLLKSANSKEQGVSLLNPDPEALATRDNEMPSKVTKSIEQFLQDEDAIKALEDQQEDLKRTEEDVMESSLSTDWSEEELVPSSKEKEQGNKIDLDPEYVNKKTNEVDRSKAYEVPDDFEEDNDSESAKLGSFVPKDQDDLTDDADKPSDKNLESNNNNDDHAVSNKSNSSKKSSDRGLDVLANEDIKNTSNAANRLEVKSPPKKSEGDDLSTSDMLSMDIEDEDTQDVSILSDDKGMSSCEHVVSIK